MINAVVHSPPSNLYSQYMGRFHHRFSMEKKLAADGEAKGWMNSDDRASSV